MEGIIQSEAQQNYPIALIAHGEIEKAKAVLKELALDKKHAEKANALLEKLK